jgi:hypothetical protein
LKAFASPLHLLYADEVNVSPENSEFFVYGGIAIPGDRAAELSDDIETLRELYRYQPTVLLKFNTRERPEHVKTKAHAEIKRLVIKCVAKREVKLFASFVLHKIAKKGSEDARRLGINRICFHFNKFLHRVDGHGLILVDTFNDGQRDAILREKFSIGLTGLPYSDPLRLDRILGFHVASIGTSNFCSAIDIVLGSLRFAINSRTDAGRYETAMTLLKQIGPLCLRTDSGQVDKLSLFFSPKKVTIPPFQETYRALQKMLTKAGMEPEQEITDET